MAAVAQALEVRNPATLERVGEVQRTRPEDVAAAVERARVAQQAWWALGAGGRAVVLRRAAREMLDAKDDVARTIVAETAKPLVEALTNDVWVAIETAAWLARNAEPILRRERVRYPQLNFKFKRGWIVYEPLGVMGVIPAWNYPYAIPFVQTAHSLAAGNGVVLKPSELTPLTGDWVARIFERAGAPRDLVSVVHGEADVGEALVRADGVDKILFTGSGKVGKLVAAAAAERLCPVTLELGGKDAMLVFADADLNRAVSGALFGAFGNCGQTCVGVERIFVERSRYEDFVAALAARTRGLRIGTDVGPLISERQRAHVEALVDDARDRGARIVAGGARPEVELPGWFYEPTLVADPPADARIVGEEIFGPAVTVEAFDGEDDAVGRANESEFGLGGSVWTRDADRARRVARRMEAGMVWTNDYGYSWGTPQSPWGGVKQSGYGRIASKHGLYELSRIRYLDADSGRVGVPWWFPYGESLTEGFRGSLDVVYGRRARALWAQRRGFAELARRYARRS